MTAFIPENIGRAEVMRQLDQGSEVVFRHGIVVGDFAVMMPSFQNVLASTIHDLINRGWIVRSRSRGIYDWLVKSPVPTANSLRIEMEGSCVS